MILDECKYKFRVFFFKIGFERKTMEIFDYTRFYSFCFFLFLRGIIKEKKDCLCKAAHHLFIPLAHVTFRDNT